MAARKKSGNLSLRMEPELHVRLAKTAKARGKGINELLNEIIHDRLPAYELLVEQKGEPKQQQGQCARSVFVLKGGDKKQWIADFLERLQELEGELKELSQQEGNQS